MPINDKPKRPRPNLIATILLFLPGLVLLFNLVLPLITGPQAARVPYSFFIEQVRDQQGCPRICGTRSDSLSAQGGGGRAWKHHGNHPDF